MNQILLSGDWGFRLDGETAWRQIRVPGCWEQIGVRKDISGPAWYRTSFVVPAGWGGKRIWLRFGDHNGVTDETLAKVRARVLESFTPVAPAWRLSVATRMAAIQEQALSGLRDW